jgi:energy-coupling factor transport system ATP-binding protein
VNIVDIKNLWYTYPNGENPVLRDIKIKIDRGEFILLTGPSGCGKTTFCRTLNGLIPHFYKGTLEGSIRIDGKLTTEYPISEFAKKVGLIFQNPDNQIFALTVEKDIAFGLENLGYPREKMIDEIEWALDITEISHLKSRATHELSGGQKQRLTIASVLAMHPDLIVMDEPTSFLDPVGAEKIFEVLDLLNKEYGMTIILIEHRTDLAVNYIDRLIVFDEGKIVNDGHPREVFQSEDVRLMGIGIPKILSLGKRLQKVGVPIKEIPLTVDDLYNQIIPLIIEENIQYLRDKHKIGFEDVTGEKGHTPVIETRGVFFSYPNDIQALKDVTFSVNKGDFLAIMGENGAGKSTLVKHFNNLLKPDRGQILVNGEDIRDYSVAELSRRIGLVFQNPDDQLFEEDVEQEISFALKNFGFKKDVISKRVDWALKLMDLERYRNSSPFILSGGERKRVALASVLAWDPDILILDEPTIGQDHGQKEKLSHFLLQLRTQGKTLILVTHDVEFVAELEPRIVLMSEGRIIEDGTAKEIMTNLEALRKASVSPPEITRLFDRISSFGVPKDVLNVDDATRILLHKIKEGDV